jgi:hypothetical protein
MIITTVHGTKFNIDFTNKTWERTDKTGDSGNLRDESGTFFEASTPTIGQPFILKCPPRIEAATGRMIITSPVTEIEE